MFLLSLVALANAAAPKGWIVAGTDPSAYEAGTVPEAHTGSASARFHSIKAKPDGFGTLMQSMSATNYSGQRVRMTAWVRSDTVGEWAGMWMRVDAPGENAVSFDNMGDRPIKGTTAWTRYAIVLDVPARANVIAFGILVEGTGSVWIDDLEFEIVDDTVPLTGSAQGRTYEPINPSFEE